MKNLNKFIFIGLTFVMSFTFFGCYYDSYVRAMVESHELRLTNIETTLSDYAELKKSIEDLKDCKDKVDGFDTVIEELKKEQDKLSDKIYNVNSLSDSELNELKSDMNKLNHQIEDISSFINSIDVYVKPLLLQGSQNKTLVAFVIENGMPVYVSGNGNTLSSEIYPDVNIYTYFVNGQRGLTLDGFEVNNYPNQNDMYHPRIEEYFGVEICDYIANAYSEILKPFGYKCHFGYENPENSVRYFFIRKIMK